MTWDINLYNKKYRWLSYNFWFFYIQYFKFFFFSVISLDNKWNRGLLKRDNSKRFSYYIDLYCIDFSFYLYIINVYCGLRIQFYRDFLKRKELKNFEEKKEQNFFF